MRSLQTRLSLGLAAAMAVLVGLLVAAGGYSLQRLAEDFVAARLAHDMEALLAALRLDESGQPLLDPVRLNPVFRQPYSGHYYKIRAGGDELRSRSLWDADLDLPPAARGTVSRHFSQGPQDQELMILTRAFHLGGQEVVIAVTEEMGLLRTGLRRLTLGLTGSALLLLIGLILAQRLIVRQALKPLDVAREDIVRLAQGEIRRLDADAPVEVRPLVEEINRLLDLTAQRLQRSRHALGNLAHALKTPLTVLAQLATRPALPARDEVEREVRQMRLLIDRELKRARIAGAAMPGQRVVLAEEVGDLIATLRKIHSDKDLDIQCRVSSGIRFPGDRDDVLELLGNLLNNACQWAAGTVRLTVERKDGWLHLTVEDDGPGCPPQRLSELTGRGARIDESREGHGLGLAIVTDIVEQYGGRLRLGRSPQLGGFLAEVTLPFSERDAV